MGLTASSPIPSTSSSTLDQLVKPSASTPGRSMMTSFARTSIIAFLRRAMSVGYLEVHEGSEVLSFGRSLPGCNIVRLLVTQGTFWTRVFHSGDLGFSEAYMMGEVHIVGNDLVSVMNLWLDNEESMQCMSSSLHRVASALSGWTNALFGQTLSRARLNAMASYDQSNDLFRAFLSSEMMYSCALWGSAEGGIRGDLEPSLPSSPSTPSSSTGTLVSPSSSSCDDGALEAAQARKISHVLSALRLRPGMRLLEFGSGWGALAITAARDYGVEVDSLTLSIEQKQLADERIQAAGLEGRVRVHLMDYRHTPRDWDGCFDAFVSIEMLEHVGSAHYNTYFAIVDRALKPKNATAVVSSSTFPEARYTTRQTEDFMRRYMWPNSCLPSATALVTAAHGASRGRFTLERVENHAAHYPRTLREWGRRLDARLTHAALGLTGAKEGEPTKVPLAGVSDTQRDQTLLQTLPVPAGAEADAFEALKRKWQYLFAYAAAGFQKGYITCHMLTFVRPSDVAQA